MYVKAASGMREKSSFTTKYNPDWAYEQKAKFSEVNEKFSSYLNEMWKTGYAVSCEMRQLKDRRETKSRVSMKTQGG